MSVAFIVNIVVFSQQTSKILADSCDSSNDRLPILADLVLYYCRYAARPVLVQLYQAEVSAPPPQLNKCRPACNSSKRSK